MPAERRHPRRLLCVIGAAAVVLSGCGGAERTAAPTILDTEKVERAIERSSMAQRGLEARVSCPSGVRQREGTAFACTAVVGRERTRFAVQQMDGSGRVRYEAR